MSKSTKKLAKQRVRAEARRLGIRLPQTRRTTLHSTDILQTVESSAISTALWYFGLAITGVAVSLISPYASGLFSLFQILLLVKDMGDADDRHRLLQNFIGGLLNGLIGWGLNDGLVWIGGVAVCIIVLAKTYDEFVAS